MNKVVGRELQVNVSRAEVSRVPGGVVVRTPIMWGPSPLHVLPLNVDVVPFILYGGILRDLFDILCASDWLSFSAPTFQRVGH